MAIMSAYNKINGVYAQGNKGLLTDILRNDWGYKGIVDENPDMTPAERKAAWAGLEKVYRPHMDYEEDPFFGKGGFWQR